MNQTIQNKAKIGTYLCYIQIAAIVGILWSTSAMTENGFNWVVGAIQALPFALLLPGLLTHHHRGFSWLCFVLLIYFVFAVMAVFASNAGFTDYLFLFLTVSNFITAMYTSRWLQKVRIENAEPKDAI